MAIEKRPANPVPKGYKPPNSKPHRVQDGQSWVSIARQYGKDAKALIYANFKTNDPAEINWYLRHYVGCSKATRDGTNWVFSSSDNPGIVHIPATVINMPPLEIVGARYCDTPTENYPYRQDTFTTISSLATLIKSMSAKYTVPPIAVAGSIADEYNTRRGVKGAVDWFQDSVLIGEMPNFAIALDAWLGLDTKLLNATKHDLGLGNIKLETAKKIYNQYKSTFARKNMDWSDLVDYILTDRGTVHIAALVIRKGKAAVAPYVKDHPEEVKEAVYVTYYKQGPSYLARFNKSRARDPNHVLKPGEGCRVLLQRDKFKKALGLP